MGMFEFEGLDELSDTMAMVSRDYSKEVKKFMQKEGNALRKQTLKTAAAYVGEKTGNYRKSIKRGKHYKYGKNGADSIRVYSGSPAFHGHLIEYGHKMITHKPKNEYVGDVAGHLVFKAAADNFENVYDSDCENFAEKIIEPLNKG